MKPQIEKSEYASVVEQGLDAAFKEIVDEILIALAGGKTPERSVEPELTMRDNGLPTLSDGSYFSRGGPREYCSVLEPAYDDMEARRHGKFPKARFPACHRFFDVALDPTRATQAHLGGPSDFMRIHLQLSLEGLVEAHFRRHGERPTTVEHRRVLAAPVLRGMFLKRLPLAVGAPIALLRFDFDRLRLSPGVYIVRMSEALQRARWKGKAYGAKGHDSVLAAATHALVMTDWNINNDQFFDLARSLSQPTYDARKPIDTVMAALRLHTGFETGVAQEMLIARGWRCNAAPDTPEVYAAGARRYPATFDDFGWMRDDIPLVTRAVMTGVKADYERLLAVTDKRFDLALGRLNQATLRDDDADAILDATIGLELLLGDPEPQSISWKLRMRAAALAGLSGDTAAISATKSAVAKIYDVRSVIVHGLSDKRAAKAISPREGRQLAIDILRSVIRALIDHPRYRDPLKIDEDLLLAPPMKLGERG